MRYTLRAVLAAIVFTASACGGLEPLDPDAPNPLVRVHADSAGRADVPTLPPPESPAQALMHLLVSRPPPPSLVEKQGSSPEPVHDYKIEGSKSGGPNPF